MLAQMILHIQAPLNSTLPQSQVHKHSITHYNNTVTSDIISSHIKNKHLQNQNTVQKTQYNVLTAEYTFHNVEKKDAKQNCSYLLKECRV